MQSSSAVKTSPSRAKDTFASVSAEYPSICTTAVVYSTMVSPSGYSASNLP